MADESADELIPTRATLIKRLKNLEDHSSWQDFFDTYWKLIYGVARKSGLTEAEAQDVVQETMVGVARHMPHFTYDPQSGSFKAWLLKLTRWRITDQFRNRGPRVAPEYPGNGTDPALLTFRETADPASDALEELWDTEWEKAVFEAAVAQVKRRLDPQKYQIFDLYVNKEWPPEKVARAFNTSVDQVYLAKHRVTEMIRTEVKRLNHDGI